MCTCSFIIDKSIYFKVVFELRTSILAEPVMVSELSMIISLECKKPASKK